jgi:hypothetical protein
VKKANENAIQVSLSEGKTGLDKTEIRKYNALVRKINVEHPKPKDIQAVRKMLTETPNLWREVGDLAKLSMVAVLGDSGLNRDKRIMIETGIDDRKKDFGYKDAPALEKLLIDEIIVCWVVLQEAHMGYASAQRQGPGLPEADYWERRVNAAQARFLRGCETLARVRKLSRPSAMQVNIGAQQVNVAQGSNRADEDSEEETEFINANRLAPSSES